jgi:hypothetical protein
LIIINDKCTEVLNAIIFLASYQFARNTLTITSPNIPIILTFTISIPKVTPATTIVEECNNEDTGVGLSIAIGNQYPITQIADFPSTAIIIHTQCNEPPIKSTKMAKSLIRLYNTADIELPLASPRIQKPIRRKLSNPIVSQPKTNRGLTLTKKITIPDINPIIIPLKPKEPISPLIYQPIKVKISRYTMPTIIRISKYKNSW